MFLILKFVGCVLTSIIAASAEFVGLTKVQCYHLTERNGIVTDKIHQLQEAMDEAKKCGFICSCLKYIPVVNAYLPQLPQFVAPEYPAAESSTPWMPDFVQENDRIIEDYRTNLDLFERMKTWMNAYNTSLEKSPFKFLFKTLPSEVNDVEYQHDHTHRISPMWVSLALFFLQLGPLLYTFCKPKTQNKEGKVKPEMDSPKTAAEDQITEKSNVSEHDSSSNESDGLRSDEMTQNPTDAEKKNTKGLTKKQGQKSSKVEGLKKNKEEKTESDVKEELNKRNKNGKTKSYVKEELHNRNKTEIRQSEVNQELKKDKNGKTKSYVKEELNNRNKTVIRQSENDQGLNKDKNGKTKSYVKEGFDNRNKTVIRQSEINQELNNKDKTRKTKSEVEKGLNNGKNEKTKPEKVDLNKWIKAEFAKARQVKEVYLKKSRKVKEQERKLKEKTSTRKKNLKVEDDVPKARMSTEFEGYDDQDWERFVSEFKTSNRFAILADRTSTSFADEGEPLKKNRSKKEKQKRKE